MPPTWCAWCNGEVVPPWYHHGAIVQLFNGAWCSGVGPHQLQAVNEPTGEQGSGAGCHDAPVVNGAMVNGEWWNGEW